MKRRLLISHKNTTFIMIIFQITILIAAIMLLILPLRVNFWVDVDLQFVAKIKLQFIFLFEREKNLLEGKKSSGLIDKHIIKTALEVVYIEKMTTILSLDGEDIKKDINLISTFKILSDALSKLIKIKFNGNLESVGRISPSFDSSLSIYGTIWFNLLTISVILLNIIINLIKNKFSKSRRKI